MKEAIVSNNLVEVYCEKRLERLVAVCELVHRAIMNRISFDLVLLFENLIVPSYDITRILLQQVEYAYVELLVALHRLRVVEHRCCQMAMLDIHVFESVPILHGKQLVEQNLLEVYALYIEHCDEAIVVAFVAHHVVAVPLLLVNVDVLMDDGLRRAHLQG